MNMNPPVLSPGRLRWHSRRALLELDLVLERFWQRQEQDGKPLDDEQAQILGELLQLEDHDLWDMLCGRQAVADPRWQALVATLAKV
ncbi:conserved protein of unknown function [Sterolibacterium denitrificans]|uniref:FAD assembly factor SdhE n=2 Tax=Sterolibacterium denitrificans TaxID=157592 RepID=A0A7Z7HS36_9PROT|nr:conserved protein of unknown function [Sterolibacterium denitrificans]